ncbi:pilus assembly protein [Pseudaminobacter arsenicus]|uniref:Pilus assembly protein n=1 Tax=Borborobacter arsenicus TaxID=1851146 RepID=A0A432V2W3_9HYPH|nr:TadE/TadG family type IV pilus assembly protein [Pseudaminobacter arsenicus]RUM96430.1 pilus assembly protein [Pseudaminobacter arsenicus]
MLIQRFWHSRSGNFAMMFAISFPAVLAGVGLALDVANLIAAKSNLQNALDSAVLAASRLQDASSSRQDAFDGFFAANIAGNHYLENAEAEFAVDPGINSIRTTATAHADVSLNFAFIFGQSARVTATASAYESTARLEVALVLDNTGSMEATNMQALREAATDLIATLEEEKTKNPDREIRAALVPFVTAVNIKGVGFKEEWIDKRKVVPEDDSSLNGVNFELEDGSRVGHWELFTRLKEKAGVNVEWKGCVEARPARYNADYTPKMGVTPNLDDTQPNPLKPETMFVPYFAPDEPGKAQQALNDGNKLNNSYLEDPYDASDKKQNNADNLLAMQRSLTKYSKSSIRNVIGDNTFRTTGPNYACPTPIVPLTTDLTTLKTEIAKMIYWQGSGTNVAEGVAWGMRVLSPGEPYTQGHPFDAKETTKVVVVFTDGENNVFGAKDALINKSDYGSYGYVKDGYKRMGTDDRGIALSNVNKLTLAACNQLKDNDVRVFTVVLKAVTATNRDLYTACATNPTDYYPTKDATELKAAFKKISYSISQLYVTN